MASRPRISGFLLASLSLVVPSAAPAQVGRGGQVELGGYSAYTRYDQTGLGFTNRLGAGGRLAVFFSRLLSLEASGDLTSTNEGQAIDEVNVTRLAGTALLHFRLGGENAVYAGAGYERAYYRGVREGTESGILLVLGDRVPLGGRAAFRIEARGALYPSSALLGPDRSVTNFGATMGLSIFAFGGPPRDEDRDGIVDRRDQCAATPFGASVDRVGCPGDGDGDGYLNGLDQCPGTPAGATVDASGCPADGDGDSVLNGIDQCPSTPAGATVDASGCEGDSDGDTVLDGLDRCPETPQGATVDAEGCPGDQDADGVLNGLDQCPDTPAGSEVDARGCSTDSDGDGVLDPVDECPNTPAGTEVDARGCRLDRDSDGDGVYDSRDRCPATRPGQQVDGVGCPILFRVEEGQRRPLILQGVNFRSGRSSLTPESYAVLDEVAASLMAHPEVRVEIAGHTDATGTQAVNQRLSRARALAVRAYLAQKGVLPNRMVAVGYGPDRPIATNSTAAGRGRNRRVELSVIEGGQ